jgi:hypothetical protein
VKAACFLQFHSGKSDLSRWTLELESEGGVRVPDGGDTDRDEDYDGRRSRGHLADDCYRSNDARQPFIRGLVEAAEAAAEEVEDEEAI